MRKISVLAVSLVLTLSMGLTAMAAPSPSANLPGLAPAIVTSGGGALAGSLTILAPTSADLSNPEIQALLGSPSDLSTATGLSGLSGFTLLSLFEADYSGSSTDLAAGVKITFYGVVGVSKGDSVKVLHYNGTDWEQFSATATADGTVEVSGITSCSPFAIVVDKDTTTSTSSSSSSSTTAATATSPQTGESNTILLVELLAVAMVGMMAVAYRRTKRA